MTCRQRFWSYDPKRYINVIIITIIITTVSRRIKIIYYYPGIGRASRAGGCVRRWACKCWERRARWRASRTSVTWWCADRTCDIDSWPGEPNDYTHASPYMHAWASAHRSRWGQLTPWKNGWKIKKRKHAKKSSFLCLCYILRAIGAGRCRERRYAGDHIYIFQNTPFRSQIFQIFFAAGGKGHRPPNQNPADVPAYTGDAIILFIYFNISGKGRKPLTCR